MSSEKINVAIIGGGGYVGAELLRILVQHPNVAITMVCGRSHAGKTIAEVLPSLAGILDKNIHAFDADTVAANADAVFCALPHGASAGIVSSLLDRQRVVFDLSADFRLNDPRVYEQWYGTHLAPERFGTAAYGLVELHRESLRDANLVAVPGCFPTAAVLALAPLLQHGLAQPTGIIVDAKTGVSGAGRAARASSHFPEAAEGVRAYKVAAHRHSSEMEQELSRVANAQVKLTFVPHLVPMTRGILATTYATLSSASVSEEQCTQAARELYKSSPSVFVHDPGVFPDTLWVRGSNRAHLTYKIDAHTDRVIAMASIDNLVKGAAGQAVQAFNVRFGFSEGQAISAPAHWP